MVPIKCIKPPPPPPPPPTTGGFGCCSFIGGGSVVVDFLFIVTPIVGVCNCSMFCGMLLYVHSSFAIILMGKRELVALLCLSSWCLVIVVWLFLTVPWVCLWFVIVVFPDNTHLLIFCPTRKSSLVVQTIVTSHSKQSSLVLQHHFMVLSLIRQLNRMNGCHSGGNILG